MHKDIRDKQLASCPKFNMDIVNGLATRELRDSAAYIDMLLNIAARKFPEGFEVLPSRRCTPEEEYEQASKPRFTSSCAYEIAPSTVYLQMYRFTFEGKPLSDRYLWLPYSEQAGLVKLKGPTYSVSPVLTDPVLEVTKSGLFMPVTRDRVAFSRFDYSFGENNRTRTSCITYSNIHKVAKAFAKRQGIRSTLAHYLFCKYGFEGTLQRYFNANVVVGYGDTINTENYPESSWVICHSLGNPPKGRTRATYEQPMILVAIPVEQYSEPLRAFIAGFFYVCDYFPHRVVPAHTNNPTLWCTLMGITIFREQNEGKMLNDTIAHLNSLADYIDDSVKLDIEKVGLPVNDIYDMFVYVATNIADIMAKTDLSDMSGKYLTVLRYVLLDITKAIFNLQFKFGANRRRPLNHAAIDRAIGTVFTKDIIFRIRTKHGEVNQVLVPNDSTLFKITARIVRQDEAIGRSTGRSSAKSGGSAANDPVKRLHPSIAIYGSLLFLSKTDANMQRNINPYAPLDPDGRLGAPPKRHLEVLEKVRTTISKQLN